MLVPATIPATEDNTSFPAAKCPINVIAFCLCTGDNEHRIIMVKSKQTVSSRKLPKVSPLLTSMEHHKQKLLLEDINPRFAKAQLRFYLDTLMLFFSCP